MSAGTRARAAALQWVTGSPLWAGATAAVAGGDREAMRRPALLRFASDDFMDDLASILADRPGSLGDHLARPLSFRAAPSGAPATWHPVADRLKLYQPLHGDFNLVMASLVCGLTGLPDHGVRPGEAEHVGFVLRRIGPGGTELAWAPDPSGGTGRCWLPVALGAETALAQGEELFPLFPVVYPDGARTRRLYGGLVPVSSRETFRTAGRVEPFPPRGRPGGRQDDDPRWSDFDARVIGPLADLRALPPQLSEPALEEEASAFLLLDLADLLRRHLPAVWDALGSQIPPAGEDAARLYAALLADAAVDWRGGLLRAADQWQAITGEAEGPVTVRCNLRRCTIDVPTLQALIRAALPPAVSPPPLTPDGLDVPKIEPTGEATYRIRCVYRRPRCTPFPVDLVSEPTQTFAIAPVLDPDAPGRQIRIPLPVDTSIKDLRKFRKNVGFVLSNQLRGQMNRVTSLKDALNGDLGAEEHWDLGMLCQFSLPLIMICALIVLIVFVSLLNIVFFWVPIFRVCLPVPVRSKS